uniref:Isoleucyl-tRNA synthetase n=1 Tax=Aegilops tauschii subsp. strangulata TaxID=200361 RepID=A0A453CBR8_AEGTS
MPTEELLPEKYRDKASEYRKGTDTMDVWFDSGSSWAAVSAKRDGLNFPADVYLEGSDQHRGWFQSSLLTSIATTGKAPYSSVITHGFVLDEEGFKMSKSVGNVVDPEKVIVGGKNSKEEPPYGADVLRLWVSSVDYTGDVLIGSQILRQMSDMYRKLRGTMRFLLANLHDWKPENSVPYSDLPKIDQYALFQLENVVASMKDGYDNYQFYKIYQRPFRDSPSLVCPISILMLQKTDFMLVAELATRGKAARQYLLHIYSTLLGPLLRLCHT